MTILSMTGYAVSSGRLAHGQFSLELRSVNSRFVDLHFKLHDAYRSFEPMLREHITAKIGRGKIECRLNYQAVQHAPQKTWISPEQLTQLISLQSTVHEALPQARALSVAECLHLSSTFNENIATQTLQAVHAQDDDSALMRSLIVEALDNLIAMRGEEGLALSRLLTERLDAIDGWVARLTPALPAAIKVFEQRAIERLRQALGLALNESNTQNYAHINEADLMERIRQEVTLYGMRIDVAEELNRLSAHVQQIRHIVQQGGTVGKRLDFMMQELNREANTLGAKAATQEFADASIELKILIEQMREQVQNLE